MSKIAIIGDFNSNSKTHQATNEAIIHSNKFLESHIDYDWIPTEQIENNFDNITTNYQSYWLAPGSPYKSMNGALKIIEFARINNRPTIGTCMGFQHLVIEFARNVLNIKDAGHIEYDPNATTHIITPLSCNLKEQILEITILDKGSKTFGIFKTGKIYEKYYCNFGVNPQFQSEIDKNGFKIVGSDVHKEARILELTNHRFFIGTLFVPQVNSTIQTPHPLITAFLKSTLEVNKTIKLSSND